MVAEFVTIYGFVRSRGRNLENIMFAYQRLRKATGFTLIELLVVIAIIAILAAILFPVFMNAKEQARVSGCCANMRQMGSAFAMYVDNYNGRYPAGVRPASDKICPYQAPGNVTWDMAIFSYVKNLGVFHCPSDVYKRPTVPGWMLKPYPRSYAINDQLLLDSYSHPDPSTSNHVRNLGSWTQGEMKSPASRYILLTEWYPGQLVNGKLTSYYANDIGYPTYQSLAGDGFGSDGMHKNGNVQNYLFFDGHVASGTVKEYSDKKWWAFLPNIGYDRK